MRYVQRNQAGAVIGHFACEQTYAQELLADDHPHIEAWEAEREEAQRLAQEASPSKTIPRLEQQVASLQKRIADLEGIVRAAGLG